MSATHGSGKTGLARTGAKSARQAYDAAGPGDRMPDLMQWTEDDVRIWTSGLDACDVDIVRECWTAAVNSGGANDNIPGTYVRYMLVDMGIEEADARRVCEVVATSRFLRTQELAKAAVAAQSEALPEDLPELVNGAAFVLDQPEGTPAVWGEGDHVLWAEGEALMIAGAQGLGKTTLAGLLVEALLCGGDVLGLPVRSVDRPILYLAMDRPRQAARSLRRQLVDVDPWLLEHRLAVWKGPPPADLAANPSMLAELAERANAGVVIVDSLKDAALGLSEDSVGASWNRARQIAIAQGVQVLELQHVRKSAEKEPTIADVYGSTWLTSGCGSVIYLQGEPGDPFVRFHHVKQPAEAVGPLTVLHSPEDGAMTVHRGADLLELVRASRGGVTAKAAACAVFEKERPNRNEIEKTRRRLEALVSQGSLRTLPKTSHTAPVTYVDAADLHAAAQLHEPLHGGDLP